MSGHLSMLTLGAWLALVATSVHADGWWGSVGGAASDAWGQAKEAGEVVASTAAVGRVEDGAASWLQEAQNATGDALQNAKESACDLKVWQSITDVNRTMCGQLRADCKRQAAKVQYMRTRVFGACESMGLWNINRTLEAQKSVLNKDCLEMLMQAPDDMAAALSKWSQRSQQTLTEKVGPSIEEAINRAKAAGGASTPESGEAASPLSRLEEKEMQAKFSPWIPMPVHRGLPGTASFLALVLVAVLAAFVRHRRSMRPEADIALLCLEDSEQEDLEA